MFTGIVEGLGKIVKLEKEQSNLNLWIEANFVDELKIDQSVAHNGVCLTVVDFKDGFYKATAIDETLLKTNFNTLKEGDFINLERCLMFNGRIDGHIVQGHVDQVGEIVSIENQDGSNLVQFSVAIIPYTWDFTNLSQAKVGDTINLEFDIIGKYVKRLFQK